MKSKIFVSIGVILSVLIIIGFYFNHSMRAKSPFIKTSIKTDEQEITVSYCSPSVRGRKVFGGDDALQQFGKYWRMGANEMTTISFSDDIMLGKHYVPSGTYGFYAIPFEDSFEVRLNKEFDRWGYNEPNYTKDIAREKVDTYRRDTSVESLLMEFDEKSPNSIVLMIEWEHYRWYVPIERVVS